ncbi:uncharacterized protein BDW70DRAFT_145335 [Aspergillus foveolatus]|uniref:uncharacterized protein n=1 Tax=Aspergillus foveolatus TaxID=210207 RepID=UPI003CCE51A7
MSTVEKSSRETWTSEEDERLVSLRNQYWQLTWDRFTQRFFPKRSRAALTWRWGMLTKDEDQPPFLTDHPARQRRRGPRPRRGCRGGLSLASRQSAISYRPRRVNDTAEDDDDCSWNSSESDEDEPAAGMAEDGRNDAMLDEASVASAASIATVPQAPSTQLQRPVGLETGVPTTPAGPRQAVEEIGVSSTVSPVRKSTDVPHNASPSVSFPLETVPAHSAAHTSPLVPVGRVNWQIGDQPAPGPDPAQQGQTTSSGPLTGTPRSRIAVEAAAGTPELVTRSPDPTATAPIMPRLSEVAKQQETMMDQVMAENSRLKIELRDLKTAYNEVVGERDQLRDDCMIVRQLESKRVLDLFAQWARQ